MEPPIPLGIKLIDIPYVFWSATPQQQRLLLNSSPLVEPLVLSLTWMRKFTKTWDEHDTEQPYKHLPDYKYFDVLSELFREESSLFVKKSRTVMATWWGSGECLHYVMTHQLLAAASLYTLKSRKLTASKAGITSLAVLPLENLSGDPEQQFFVDGVTETLIADLAQISALRVISRTSVMQYKGTRKTLPEIARELHADAFVEGSVFRSGNRVRVTAQLVEATDRHLWAENYEFDLRDALASQSNVAQAIAGAVRAKLTPPEKARLASVRPVNPEAQEAYLRGLFFLNFGHDNLELPRGVEALHKSIEYYQQAIKLDPNYAEAFAGLARACHWLANVERPVEFYEQSIEAGRRALQLDEGLAEAHAALGRDLHVYKLDWLGAEREFKRAFELKPGYGEAHHGYAFYLETMGRLDEAVVEINRALDLDPLAVEQRANAGWIYTAVGDYDRAIGHLQSALEVSPHSAQYRVYLAS